MQLSILNATDGVTAAKGVKEEFCALTYIKCRLSLNCDQKSCKRESCSFDYSVSTPKRTPELKRGPPLPCHGPRPDD
jgi:hypothetical protein